MIFSYFSYGNQLAGALIVPSSLASVEMEDNMTDLALINCSLNVVNRSSNMDSALYFARVMDFYLLFPIGILGIIGNILTYIVLKQDGSKSVTFYLLKALAVADTFVLITWLCQYVIPKLAPSLQISMVRWVWPLARMSYTTAIWMVVIVAAERYMVVCHPQRACTIFQARNSIIFIIIGTILFHMPSWFMLELITIPCTNQTGVQGSDLAKNKYFQVTYDIILYSLVNILVPLVALIVFNEKLISTLQAARKTRRGLGMNTRREDTGTILLLIIIIIIFLICNSPMMIAYIWGNAIQKTILGQPPTPEKVYLDTMADVLAALNSSVNFIVYCMFSSKFQEMATKLFLHMCAVWNQRVNGKPESISLRTDVTFV